MMTTRGLSLPHDSRSEHRALRCSLANTIWLPLASGQMEASIKQIFVFIFNYFIGISKNDCFQTNLVEGLDLTSMDPILFFSKRLWSFATIGSLSCMPHSVLAPCQSEEVPSARSSVYTTRDTCSDPRAMGGFSITKNKQEKQTFFTLYTSQDYNNFPFSFLPLSPSLILGAGTMNTLQSTSQSSFPLQR